MSCLYHQRLETDLDWDSGGDSVPPSPALLSSPISYILSQHSTLEFGSSAGAHTPSFPGTYKMTSGPINSGVKENSLKTRLILWRVVPLGNKAQDRGGRGQAMGLRATRGTTHRKEAKMATGLALRAVPGSGTASPGCSTAGHGFSRGACVASNVATFRFSLKCISESLPRPHYLDRSLPAALLSRYCLAPHLESPGWGSLPVRVPILYTADAQ